MYINIKSRNQIRGKYHYRNFQNNIEISFQKCYPDFCTTTPILTFTPLVNLLKIIEKYAALYNNRGVHRIKDKTMFPYFILNKDL